MKIKNMNTHENVNISLRLYRGGWDCGLEPDVLQDVAADDLNARPHDDDGYPMMSADDLRAFISWWQDEAQRSNSGRDGDGLCGLTEAEIDRGDEWMLITAE